MKPTTLALGITSLLFFGSFVQVSFVYSFLERSVQMGGQGNPADSEQFYLASLSSSLLIGTAFSIHRFRSRLRRRDKLMGGTLAVAGLGGLSGVILAPEHSPDVIMAVCGVVLVVMAGTILDRKSPGPGLLC